MIILLIFCFMLPAFVFIVFFLMIQKMDHPIACKINRKVDEALDWRKRYRRPLPEIVFIGCLVVGLLLVSHMVQPVAVWNEGEIHVYWNEAAKNYVTLIDSCFGGKVRTPQNEPVYFVQCHGVNQLQKTVPFQFVLIVADAVSDSLPERLSRKRSDNRYIQHIKNVWYRNQTVYVVYSDVSKQKENRELLIRVCDQIKKDMEQEIKKGLFRHHDAKKRKRQMLKSFGWTFETLADFELRIVNPDHGFVSLSPKTGNRWINIRWIDEADSSWLNTARVVKERNVFGNLYYHGTKVEELHLYSRSHRFLNYPALTVRGLWGNDTRVIGGPFKTTAFYDSAMKRLYLVDCAVYASGMRKMPLLRRAEIVANSFRTRRSQLFDSQ